MPKNATKAADNVFYQARWAAAKNNDRLASRDGAAEETGIDRTRIARIELGSLVPYPEEVLIMADTYCAPQLSNYYCTQICPLGKETVPPCSLIQIDRLTVKILNAMRGANYIRETILDITGDGEISDGEIPQLQKIMANLEAMECSAMELRLWIEKHLKRGKKKK